MATVSVAVTDDTFRQLCALQQLMAPDFEDLCRESLQKSQVIRILITQEHARRLEHLSKLKMIEEAPAPEDPQEHDRRVGYFAERDAEPVEDPGDASPDDEKSSFLE